MAVELSAERIGYIQRENLEEKIEIVPFSQRVQMAVSNFVEYPAAPWRPASTKHSWYLGHWLDYQVQKLAGKNGK